MTVGEGNLDRRITGNHAQSVVGQAQFGNHFRAQHAGNVRSGGHAAAGRDLFGHATSANNFPALEHQRGKSGARQVGRSSQSVVAGADYDRVVNVIRGLRC